MDAAQPAVDPAVEGIDVEPVSEWMTSHIEGAEPPLRFDLIAGGRSNLTYRVTDHSGRSFALRRPPVSHVLPTAHDMGREFTVIERARTDRRAGSPYLWALHRSVGQRSTLLRHVLRRGPHRARRANGLGAHRGRAGGGRSLARRHPRQAALGGHRRDRARRLRPP